MKVDTEARSIDAMCKCFLCFKSFVFLTPDCSEVNDKEAALIPGAAAMSQKCGYGLA